MKAENQVALEVSFNHVGAMNNFLCFDGETDQCCHEVLRKSRLIPNQCRLELPLMSDDAFVYTAKQQLQLERLFKE